MDRDCSGTIDKEELAFMFRSLGQNPSQEELDNMMAEADGGAHGDGDGRINLREFLEWYAIAMIKDRDTQAEDIKQAFTAIGGTVDEGIEKERIKQMLFQQYEIEVDIDDIFDTATPSSSFLKMEEFTKMMDGKSDAHKM